MTCKKTKHFLP